MVNQNEYNEENKRCFGNCDMCDYKTKCYQYELGKDIDNVKRGIECTQKNEGIRKVNFYEAIQAVFNDEKEVLVRHHCNGIDFDEIWKLGKNIAMLTDIKVTVIVNGEFYILD